MVRISVELKEYMWLESVLNWRSKTEEIGISVELMEQEEEIRFNVELKEQKKSVSIIVELKK